MKKTSNPPDPNMRKCEVFFAAVTQYAADHDYLVSEVFTTLSGITAQTGYFLFPDKQSFMGAMEELYDVVYDMHTGSDGKLLN